MYSICLATLSKSQTIPVICEEKIITDTYNNEEHTEEMTQS